VNKAIDKGVAWLKSKQLPDGSWGVMGKGEKYDPKAQGETYNNPAGPTSLALYALLKCKVAVNDPVVVKGFKHLKDKWRIPGSSYETSCLLLAVTATADPFKRVKASAGAGERIKLTGEYRKWAQDLQADLIKKRSSGLLGWRYNRKDGHAEPGGDQDLSSTQLAALALFAAERCGIKTESKVWNDIITFTLDQQEADGPPQERAIVPKPSLQEPTGDDKGRYAKPDKPVNDRARGFAYIKSNDLPPDEGAPTGGMTACGIGSIMLARYVLGNRKDKLWENRDKEKVQQALYDGLAWLSLNWQPWRNPMKQRINPYYVYYHYCVERAMDLVGNQLLGKHQWYIEIGSQLIGKQKPQGFWNSQTTLPPEEILDTSFALLFLKRATKGGIGAPSITNTGEGDEPIDNRGK
jgi:hypothetical protein